MVKVLKPLKRSKLPEEELKRREADDKRLIEGMYFSADGENHEIECDKYDNYRTRWLLIHGQKQSIPNMVYKEIQRCYYKENEHLLDSDGMPIKEKDPNIAKKKEYLHRFEPL